MLNDISIREKIKRRYKELFKSSLDLIYVLDINGNFIDANDIALDTFGYKKEEICKIAIQDLISDLQIDKAINALKDIIKKGRNKNYYEYEVKTKDGKFIFIETYISIILPIIDWKDLLIHLYVIYKSGVLLYSDSFKKKYHEDESLIFSCGIVGIMTIIKEIINSNKKIQSISHEDRQILFELNKTEDVIFAFVVKEDIELLRNKLKSIVNEFDMIYRFHIEHIKVFSIFTKKWCGIEKIVEKYLS